MLNCGKCGASTTAESIYCSICGTRLKEASTNTPNKKSTALNLAASALAKASGLSKSQRSSRIGLIVRSLSVFAGILLLCGAYLVYRSQNIGGGSQPLNFSAPLDKFNQLVTDGQRFYDQGDISGAIARYEEAEKLIPHHTGVILKLAYAYDATGQVDSALQKLNRVVELDSKNIEARYQRADLLLNRGIWPDAYEDLEYIIANAPNSEQAIRARQILNHFIAKRPPEAIADSKLPGNNRRGRHGIQLPNVMDSRPRLDVNLPKLATEAPTSLPMLGVNEDPSIGVLAKIHKDKGERYLVAKQFYAAISELQSARKFAPDDPDIYYYLGSSHDGLKQYAQARKYYEMCDSGVYVGVARSAAKNAKKNEEDEIKRQNKKNRKVEKSDE